MDFKPYPIYKDSGVQWLGEVPESWLISRLKFYSNLNMGQSPDSSSYHLEEGIPFLQGNAEFGEFHPTHKLFCKDPKKISKINDILFSVRAPVGDVNISNIEYCIGRGLCAITPNKLNSAYSIYALDVVKRFLGSVSKGTTFEGVTLENLENSPLLVPSICEQTQIASFLDTETSRIDNLIAKQEKLIEKLEEHRKSVISHAVTKGLDPNVPMKDSGVEWLGEVPEHWTIGRLKHLVQIKNGSDYKDIEVEKSDSSYPVYGSGGVFSYASDFMYDKESILLGRKGTIDKPLYVTEPFWAVDTMFYTKIKKNAVGKFIYYQALGFPFGKYSSNTALPSMTQTDLLNLAITIPSVDEQNEIVRFTDEKCLKIDRLISKQRELIEKLKSYRTSIISHVVTGKIDVRDLVA